ncbi:MAG TPA: transaldolase [Vicinamibacterales bacterium]
MRRKETPVGPSSAPQWDLPVPSIADLRVKLYADGATANEMIALAATHHICGFTTNPTLMRKAGVRDYERFARELVERIPDRPISFEVIADDFPEMERQARLIASWGSSVVVKIPVSNTRGEACYPLVRRLSHDGVRVNVTAILSLEQVERTAGALRGGAESNVSIFAGRIADTGRDPVPMVACALRMLSEPQMQLIWASPRELLNVYQADAVGCHIITMTTDLLKKLQLVGKDLAEFSLETVRMFRDDAVAAGLTLPGHDHD